MEITVRLKSWMKLGCSPQYIQIVPRRHLVQLIVSTLARSTPHKKVSIFTGTKFGWIWPLAVRRGHHAYRGGGRGEVLYGVFSAGENSTRGIFRTCPKKSRGKFRTSQILSALQTKGIKAFAVINDSSAMEVNPASANGPACCWYPRFFRKRITLASGTIFTAGLATFDLFFGLLLLHLRRAYTGKIPHGENSAPPLEK